MFNVTNVTLSILARVFVLQTTSQVVSFKHGSAACVCADGSFGVVCYEKQSIFCATCKYGTSSCKHITCVTNLLQEQLFPDSLKHWMISGTTTQKSSCLCVLPVD